MKNSVIAKISVELQGCHIKQAWAVDDLTTVCSHFIWKCCKSPGLELLLTLSVKKEFREEMISKTAYTLLGEDIKSEH